MDVSGIDLEQIRAWMSTGFLGFIALLLARFASPIGAYMTKRLEVKAQERKDEREGYGPLLDALRADIETVRQHHAECEEARRKDHQRLTDLETQHAAMRQADRERIAELEAQVIGLTRVVTGISTNQAVALPSSAGKDHMLNIAERSAQASLDAISKHRETKDDG